MLPSLLSVTLLLASTDEKRMTLLQEKKKKGLWLGNCFPRAVDSTAETATGSLPLRGWSDRSFENEREGTAHKPCDKAKAFQLIRR